MRTRSLYKSGWKYLFVVALEVMLLVPTVSNVWAKMQVVDINKSFPQDSVFKPDAEKLRNEALVQGAIQEMNNILNVELSSPEKELFKGYLKSRINDYVLSYSRERQVIGEEHCSLTMNVSLNTHALKELLKTWGTYYTAHKEWNYTLDADIAPGEKKEILMLESMSGLERKSFGFPSLELHKIGHNKWLGILKTQENVWVAKDPELYLVWKRLWSRYFSHPDILAQVEEELFVRIGYWASVTGMQGFDKKMSDWEYLLDRAKLKSVYIKAEGVSGCWRIETVNPTALKKQLLEFVESGRLDYNFSSEKKACKNNGF